MAVENTPAAPVANVAEKTDEQFQAEALAALEADTKPDQAQPEVKVSEQPKDEPKTEVKPEEKPEEKKDAEPKAEDLEPLRRGFDSLAREKASLRRKEAEIDAKIKLLERYESAKTPLDLLQTKGFSYDDVTRQILKGEHKPAEKAEEKEPSWVSEFRELKQQLQQERAMNSRRELESKFADYASKNAESLPYTSAKGDQKRAFGYLQDYVKEFGELPAETIEDSIAMSFRALEKDNQAEIEKAAALLTKIKKPAISVPAVNEKAVSGAESSQAEKHKTLTNSMASPGKPAKAPKLETAEDYQAAALALLESRQN